MPNSNYNSSQYRQKIELAKRNLTDDERDCIARIQQQARLHSRGNEECFDYYATEYVLRKLFG